VALASHVARLREVLLQGPGTANRQTFGGGFATVTRPTGADGVVIFPDRASLGAGALTLMGDPGDTGLSISKIAPTIVCTTATVTLHNVSGSSVAVRWFRLQ
jgi:hypothetical protein